MDRYTTSQERRLGHGTDIRAGSAADVRHTAAMSPTFGPECYTSRAESRALGGDLAMKKSVDSALLELRNLCSLPQRGDSTVLLVKKVHSESG